VIINSHQPPPAIYCGGVLNSLTVRKLTDFYRRCIFNSKLTSFTSSLIQVSSICNNTIFFGKQVNFITIDLQKFHNIATWQCENIFVSFIQSLCLLKYSTIILLLIHMYCEFRCIIIIIIKTQHLLHRSLGKNLKNNKVIYFYEEFWFYVHVG